MSTTVELVDDRPKSLLDLLEIEVVVSELRNQLVDLVLFFLLRWGFLFDLVRHLLLLLPFIVTDGREPSCL